MANSTRRGGLLGWLADLVLREQQAPHLTIRQIADMLPINLERLLTDLERLAAKSTVR